MDMYYGKKLLEMMRKFGGHMLSIMQKEEQNDLLHCGMIWMETKKQLEKSEHYSTT